ncbi:MAG: hypothetical protein ACOY45_07690 [Pseudomonadota bacterium]
MFVSRLVLTLAAAVAGLFAVSPASAQFFLRSADLSDVRVTGAEPGMIGPALPNATPDELRAALVWNLRAALNVAALQCDFEPTLLTLPNYNGILKDHDSEFDKSLATLEKYFQRTYKNKKQAQTEFDRFGTRVYSSFSTVSGQFSFCQTAASVGHQAIFTPRGRLADLAAMRMRELRKSLAPWGEQAFNRRYIPEEFAAPRFPPFANDKCWKKGAYVAKKCGSYSVN